jgi:hypothetical protein
MLSPDAAVQVLHLVAAAESQEEDVPGLVVGLLLLQGASQFDPAVVHELYPLHDLVLFHQLAVLTLQL